MLGKSEACVYACIIRGIFKKVQEKNPIFLEKIRITDFRFRPPSSVHCCCEVCCLCVLYVLNAVNFCCYLRKDVAHQLASCFQTTKKNSLSHNLTTIKIYQCVNILVMPKSNADSSMRAKIKNPHGGNNEILKDLCICLTGLAANEKSRLHSLIQSLGGR